MAENVRIVTEHFEHEDLHMLEGYRRLGGYEALKKVLSNWEPEAVIEEVKKANLRGRGGAGFSAGLKWSFVPKGLAKPKYLCVNADEGEPGTFKDKLLMERCPHRLMEGIVIASYAVGIKHAYIYIRGEFVTQAITVQKAVDEAYANNLLGENILGSKFSLEVTVHRGAGAYICGEETGLISSLEGCKGQPKLKPPFPAVEGAFGCPTVVNNVETLCFVPWIINRGADEFLKYGSEKNPGTRMFCISGHVNTPGVFELPMGTPVRELIYTYGGGIPGDKKLKAVIPGGASAPWLTPDQIDVGADFDQLRAAGSMGGSGGIIVMDETVCAVKAVTRITKFFAHESCGQCTPCREGTDWAYKIFYRILQGKGTEYDLKLLENVCNGMVGKTICVLADAAAGPILCVIKKFRSDFDRYLSAGFEPEKPSLVDLAQLSHGEGRQVTEPEPSHQQNA